MDISKVVGGGKRTDWMSRSSSKLAWKLSYRRGRSLSRWPVGMFFRFLPKFDPAKLLTSVRRWTGDIVKLRTPFYFDFFKEKRITVWCYLPTHRIFELLKRLKWLLVKVFLWFWISWSVTTGTMGPFMVEIVFCQVTRRGRKKRKGMNKLARENMRNDGPAFQFLPPEDTVKITLDLSENGPVFNALVGMKKMPFLQRQ